MKFVKSDVVEMPIESIKPYDRNPRIIAQAVPYVQRSIEKYGFRQPLLLDKSNVIICGHTRYFACKNLGYESIPCIICSDLTPKQVKEFRLVDNKVAEKAIWDYELEKLEMQDLGDDAFEMLDFGFDKTDISFGVFVTEEQEEPKSKQGQMFHSKIQPTTTHGHEAEKVEQPEKTDWLQKGIEYSQKSMESRRIIIEYDEEDTDFLLDILGDSVLKNFYTAKEIMKNLNEG